MDESWKREQLAFAAKFEQRLNPGLPGSDKGGSYKRKGPPVRFPQPYSRNPNELFVHLTPQGLPKALPAPMNNNAVGHTGNQPNQPVKYTNVRLAQQIGPHAKDTMFEVATVEFYRGQVKLYPTEIDFFNQDHAFSDIFRVESKKRYNNQFYIREILQFLQRGHSLLDPACRCVHTIDNDRAGELGISMPRIKPGTSGPEDRTSLRDGNCQLSTARCERTSSDLAHEIAVGDLYEVRDKTGERLVDVLRKNSKIVMQETPTTDLWAFKATLNASCKQELLQLVRMREPLGLKEPAEKDTYNGVRADIDALLTDGDICMLTNQETKISILFPRRRDLQLAVDDDIKQLWKDCGPKGRESCETLERALKAEGLIPTKQEKPETKIIKKKGRVMRRRKANRPGANAQYMLPLGAGH
jgi:hypothetical protein